MDSFNIQKITIEKRIRERTMSEKDKKLSKVKAAIVSCCWKIIHLMREPILTKSKDFPDLTPTDNAKNIEEYEDRLQELLVNRNEAVHEIAITSPYSGGKSSFITTYMRKHPYHRYTCISLAAFKDVRVTRDVLGSDTSEEKNEANALKDEIHDAESELNKIEKSIVQQILYRTKSEKAPNSRFRRIFPFPLPNLEAYALSVPVAIWLIVLALIYFVPKLNIERIFLGVLSEPVFSNYNLLLFAFLAAVPILLAKDGVAGLHNFTLSKINLPKGEVALTQRSNDSIFNIYLEELIYYFATTESDVVFFEDLDRFEESEIFIKLKELNKLINDSADVKQSVRFIYALKDDVFKGSDRTKFFDSIIPIIPIASTSNSFPHLRDLIVESKLDDSLDDRFLRDISVYLDDMRMLKNIVSEYGIYKNTLTKGFGNLNKRQLFSFIIYKNVYCDDFAQLHSGEGVLAEILKKTKDLQNSIKMEAESKIRLLESRLIDSENECTESIRELNSSYLLDFMKRFWPKHGVTQINNQSIYDIPEPNIFDDFLTHQGNLTFRHQYNSSVGQINHNMFGQWRDEISTQYSARKSRILDKTVSKKGSIEREISSLREEIASIKNPSLKELLSKVNGKEAFGLDESMSLLIHMIEKGYIDEHYHLYIAHFIEGNMTRSDMDYVMSVKNRAAIEPTHKINRISETLEYLTDEEYGHTAFLNYHVLNYLLGRDIRLPIKSLITNSIKGSSKQFETLQGMFENVDFKEVLIGILAQVWPDICVDIASSSSCPEEKKNILLLEIFSEMDEKDRSVLLENHDQIAAYISRNEIISKNIPTDTSKREKVFDIFDDIGVLFFELENCMDDPIFIRHCVNCQLLEISERNLKVVLAATGNKSIASPLDYSKIARVKDSRVVSLIEDNLQKVSNLILNDTMLVSRDEDFYHLLNHHEIPKSIKLEIIKSLDFSLKEVKRVNDDELISQLFSSGRVAATWGNVASGIELEQVEDDNLVSMLSASDSVESLCAEELDLSEDNLEKFSELILSLEIDEISFDAYQSKICYQYSVDDVGDVSHDRIRHLIDLDYFFDGSSFILDQLRAIDVSLSSYMLAKHFDFFSSNIGLSELTLDSGAFYSLLGMSELSQEQKRKLIKSRFELIQPDFDNNDLVDALFDRRFLDSYFVNSDIPEIPSEILLSLLENTVQIQKRKWIAVGQVQYLSPAEITEVLGLLGSDLAKIPESKSYTLIDHSEINMAVAQAISQHDYASSISEKVGGATSSKKIRVNNKLKIHEF